jgi:hypothetical protein
VTTVILTHTSVSQTFPTVITGLVHDGTEHANFLHGSRHDVDTLDADGIDGRVSEHARMCVC